MQYVFLLFESLMGITVGHQKSYGNNPICLQNLRQVGLVKMVTWDID